MAESKQRQTGYYSPMAKAQRKYLGWKSWDKEKSGDIGQKLLDANQKFSDTMVPIVKKAGSWGWKAIKKISKFLYDNTLKADPVGDSTLKAYEKKMKELTEKEKKKSSTEDD